MDYLGIGGATDTPDGVRELLFAGDEASAQTWCQYATTVKRRFGYVRTDQARR